jgi:diguanylate cyclase (GGDEF)-like protein
MDLTALNRRKFNRQPIQLSALVHPPEGRSWLCSIRDFCEEGMMLTGGSGSRSLDATGARVKAGDTVALHFSVATPSGQEHFRTQAKIARVMDGGNGLGVVFEEGLESRAFDTLVDFAVASGTTVPTNLPEPDVDELPDVNVVGGKSGKSGQSGQSGKAAKAGRPGKTDGATTLRDPSISPDAASKLTTRIGTVLQRAASRLASAFIHKSHAELLIRARDAGTNAVQTRYFESLDTLEKNQEIIAGEFVAGVVGQIEKVSDLEAVLERRRKRESGNTKKLELVDTQQFEEWLLVAEIISKTENRFQNELLDMRAQFGLLAKPWSHKDVVPVGPSSFSWAFDDAMKVMVVREDVRKELYGIFQSEMQTVLANLYSALAKLFEDSGLFPALEELREALQPKYTMRSRSGVTVAPKDYQEMDHAMRDVAMAADGVVSSRVDHNPFVSVGAAGGPAYQTAKSILDINRRTRELLGKPREASLAAIDAGPDQKFKDSDIIDALAQIQSELGDAPLSDTRLKPRLIEVLRHKHGGHKGLTEEDFDTLEVMENLVSSMSQDRLITQGVREWVQRLEVTLNKLAASDPGFLESDPDQPHSAVQMLNQLARLGNSGDVRDGIDREVGRRVDELLQRVVKDYDRNPEVFSEVLDELHPLVDRQSKTYRGNVERTVRASEGQQKLARARRTVVNEMESRLAGREVPDLLVDLLNPGWRNLLVHTHLRHGPDSNEWRDQLSIVDQLTAQLNGEVSQESDEWVDPERLLKRVVEGLSSISFDPSKRTPLIMRMSSSLVGDTTGAKTPVKTLSVAEGEVDSLLGLRGLLPDTEPQIESEDQSVRANFEKAVERARRIQVGEWLAASDREGRPLILSVAFVGDSSSSFVLVNRKGVKTLERTLQELAEDLFQGRITLLDDYDLPLMERASQRMLENMHSQLAFQASHDDLTQLLNRKEFERVIEAALVQAKSKGVQHALLYMDLDQFKIVNNTSGHRAGDELLRVVGEDLSTLFSKEQGGNTGTIARLGGDEYGVLLENVESIAARETADKVLEAIRAVTFEWEGRNYNLTASMGLVFIDQSTESVDELMQHADEACFSAKDAGRNRIQEYELGDKRMVQRHGAMEWVTQLDQALEDDRLVLNCQKIQPIEGVQNGHDVHYEILLTMMDELGDVVAPTELINAAETYNRMTSIDRWVIRNVLKWMADNRSMLDHFGGFAINVSGHSVNDTTFPDFVLDQFGKTQAPTGKVCFEITETAAIANLDNAIDFMNRMRIIGCSFSLDDFGTGLSSYSYLRNLPVDYVKIDGVFVKDIVNNPADYAVVRSINEIGHYMGKKTVAEYVEDADILQHLKDIGVDYAQGYQISKPMRLQDLSV